MSVTLTRYHEDDERLVKFINKEVLPWKAIVGAFVAVSGVAILFLT